MTPLRIAPPETEVAAMARTYAEWGWKIFPLWWIEGTGCACPVGDKCGSPGKHPIAKLGAHGEGPWVAPKGVHNATSYLPTITEWWQLAPRANIGLPAHDNGLAIIDIDPRHGGDRSWWRLLALLIDTYGPDGWPTTVVQATGSGGEHHLFAAPPDGIASTKRAFGEAYPGIDTRGRGGYVVAAPSRHASGGVYDWAPRGFMRRHVLAADTPDVPLLSPWPRALTSLMDRAPGGGLRTTGDAREVLRGFAPHRRTRPAPDERTVRRVLGWGGTRAVDRYVAVTVAAELDILSTTPEDGRNDQLNRAGYAIGRFVPVGLLDEGEAFRGLCAAARAAGLDPAEIPKTAMSGLNAGKARPTTWVPTANREPLTSGEA